MLQVEREHEAVLQGHGGMLRVQVYASVSETKGAPVLDVSALLLSKIGRIVDEDYFVFFNNERSRDDVVQWSEGQAGISRVTVALDRLSDEVDGLVVGGSIYEAEKAGVTLADFRTMVVSVADGAGSTLLQHTLPPVPQTPAHDAVVLCTVFRREGEWVFRASGEAGNGGLAGLASSFGVEIQ